jgi:hypothetical protein
MDFILGMAVGAALWWAWSKWGHNLVDLNKKGD